MKLKRQGHRNSGFTLLELLLVMAILVVLAGLSTVAVINLQKGAYQKTALVEIETMEKACKMYKLNAGSYPATLDDLYTNPTGMSRAQWGGPYLDKPISNDPWQSPYSYTKDELNDRVTITSPGPDKQTGTEDDVPGTVNQ
ncbi:MAG: type II secretion system major pseudopilin GspG [Mariniblastus sp.]